MRWCAVQLARRPLLGLTLAIVLVLLVSSISEIVESWQINAAVQRTTAANAALRQQINQTTQMITDRNAPAIIMNEARLLGWIMPPGNVSP